MLSPKHSGAIEKSSIAESEYIRMPMRVLNWRKYLEIDALLTFRNETILVCNYRIGTELNMYYILKIRHF